MVSFERKAFDFVCTVFYHYLTIYCDSTRLGLCAGSYLRAEPSMYERQSTVGWARDEYHRECFNNHAPVVELSLRYCLRIVQFVDCHNAKNSEKFLSKLCQTSSNFYSRVSCQRSPSQIFTFYCPSTLFKMRHLILYL